jgi:hypothetical protein
MQEVILMWRCSCRRNTALWVKVYRRNVINMNSCNQNFPAVKRTGRGVDHSPTSIAPVKERVEL